MNEICAISHRCFITIQFPYEIPSTLLPPPLLQVLKEDTTNILAHIVIMTYTVCTKYTYLYAHIYKLYEDICDLYTKTYIFLNSKHLVHDLLFPQLLGRLIPWLKLKVDPTRSMKSNDSLSSYHLNCTKCKNHIFYWYILSVEEIANYKWRKTCAMPAPMMPDPMIVRFLICALIDVETLNSRVAIDVAVVRDRLKRDMPVTERNTKQSYRFLINFQRITFKAYWWVQIL